MIRKNNAAYNFSFKFNLPKMSAPSKLFRKRNNRKPREEEVGDVTKRLQEEGLPPLKSKLFHFQ